MSRPPTSRALVLVALVGLLAGCGRGDAGRGAPPVPVATPAVPSTGSTAVAGESPGAVRPQPDRWRPRTGVTWQWQLSGRLDTRVAAEVYDVDLFETTPVQVRALHAAGRRVICYFSAGSWEPYRPDRAAFPASVLGRPLEGFEDERWLDVRQPGVLLPLVAAQLDLCRAKGFDGAEPDNVDGYANRSGFALRAADQLRYDRAVADLAHARGLAVALKNDLDQVAALQPTFDLAVDEQCAEYDECDALTPFVRAGKPVLHVEYSVAPARFCPTSRRLGFSSLVKRETLDAYRRTC